MGNAGVPRRLRARLFHLPLVVALRLRMRSNCWVWETMILAFVGGWLYGGPRGAEYEEILTARQPDP